MKERFQKVKLPINEGEEGSVGFRLTTLPHIDGKITQELQEYNGDVSRTLTRWVIDSSEKDVHDALVHLGWTPPNDKNALLQSCDCTMTEFTPCPHHRGNNICALKRPKEADVSTPKNVDGGSGGKKD